MKALTVRPGDADSPRVDDIDEPGSAAGAILVQGVAVGVCGTDFEIIEGGHGSPPEGEERLVLGHESLGRVLEAPSGSGFESGDLVVGIVRRPDPEPCLPCGRGEWDMCRNGRFTERGITGLHGFGSERWRIEPEYAVKVDPSLGDLGVLLEPASILAKAWDHIERIGARAPWEPETVLVTGAGPIGLMAALLGMQRGLEVHVLDRATEGPKPSLVAGLGATYHSGSVEDCPEVDIVIECTGAPQVVLDAMPHTTANGIVCLTGVSSAGETEEVDAGALNLELVMENDVVFGTVNANRRHYETAAEALRVADRSWLEQVISRRVPLDRYSEALEDRDDDVKVVIQLDA